MMHIRVDSRRNATLISDDEGMHHWDVRGWYRVPESPPKADRVLGNLHLTGHYVRARYLRELGCYQRSGSLVVPPPLQ